MTDVSFSSIIDLYRRHENKVILLVTLILSVYLIMTAAKLTWSLMPQPAHTPINGAAVNQVPNNSNSSNARVNLSAITKLNLFGDATAKPPAPVQQDLEEVPETKLNLVLSGVVSSTDEAQGAAIIEYRNKQNTYGLGDKIEGTNVTLDEILIDRVIIKNASTRETLMLEGLDFDEANRQNQRIVRQQTPTRNLQTSVNSNTDREVREKSQALKQAREQLANEPAKFTDFIALAPHRVDGQLLGFRVSPGKEPKLFNAVGLKNGDVVMQLNGLDLTDLQQSGEAITQLQQADLLQLEVLRDGEFISLELEIPRN